MARQTTNENQREALIRIANKQPCAVSSMTALRKRGLAQGTYVDGQPTELGRAFLEMLRCVKLLRGANLPGPAGNPDAIGIVDVLLGKSVVVVFSDATRTIVRYVVSARKDTTPGLFRMMVAGEVRSEHATAHEAFLAALRQIDARREYVQIFQCQT